MNRIDPPLEPFLGILMLDTQFERPLGDAGNPASYPFPARVEIVEGAGSLDIVKNGRPSDALIKAFVVAAQKLEAQGAVALTSTCGFLITIQDDIAKTVSIPVIMSALTLYPEVRSKHPTDPIGIITASRAALGNEALAAAQIAEKDVVIAGLEQCEAFARAILRPKSEQLSEVDQPAIEAEILALGRSLIDTSPDISAILLECGNLPPYQASLQRETSLPVYSIIDGMKKFKHLFDM